MVEDEPGAEAVTTGRNRRSVFSIPGYAAGSFRSYGAAKRRADFLNREWEKQKKANRDQEYVRKEWHGATLKMGMSDQRQEGDPSKDLPDVPPDHGLRPRILAGAPRALPVSQRISHGPEQSREEAFTEGTDLSDEQMRGGRSKQAAHNLAKYYGQLGFRDRRLEGRRYRPTDFISELDGPQAPYPPADAPGDMPIERFVRGW
jgi:hypothetical protein